MPQAIKPNVDRRMDHLSWIITRVLADQNLEAKRDRDGARTERYEFWEVALPSATTVFICLRTATDAEPTDRIELVIDLRDSDGEPIPAAPSVAYQSPASAVLRPLIADYLDSLYGAWR